MIKRLTDLLQVCFLLPSFVILPYYLRHRPMTIYGWIRATFPKTFRGPFGRCLISFLRPPGSGRRFPIDYSFVECHFCALLDSVLQPFPFPMLADSDLQVLFQKFSEGPGILAVAKGPTEHPIEGVRDVSCGREMPFVYELVPTCQEGLFPIAAGVPPQLEMENSVPPLS